MILDDLLKEAVNEKEKKNSNVPKIFSGDKPGNGLKPTNLPVLDKLVMLPTPTAIM